MLHTIHSLAIRFLSAGVLLLFQFSSKPLTATTETFSIPCGENDTLIAAIHAANNTPIEDTIHLAAGCTYSFSQPAKYDFNIVNALPTISAPLIIEGHGATLRRLSGVDIPMFRFIETKAGVPLTINRLRFENGGGSNTDKGGAILSVGPLTITDSIFWGNQAIFGGALRLSDRTKISGSLFAENIAMSFGGAMLVEGPDPDIQPPDSSPQVEITNTTITANNAYSGSAIFTTGIILMTNATIARNYPNPGDDTSAAMHVYAPAKIEFKNTIVDNLNKYNCKGPTLSSDDSLYRDNLCGGGTLVSDTRLGPLGEYGGPTPSMSILPSSDAIGLGADGCPSVDQRGFPRSSAPETCDAGAYETGGMILSQIQVEPDSARNYQAVSVKIRLVNTTDQPAIGIAFSGTLPAGLAVANSPEPENFCGGTFSAAFTGQNFALQDGQLEPGKDCSISFSVFGLQPGQYVINAGPLSSLEGGTTPMSAEADLVIKMDSEVVLMCCSETVRIGQPVVIPVLVRPVLPGLVIPQGTISYTIQALGKPQKLTGEQTLEEGKTFVTATLDQAGTYQVQVMYAGSRMFNASIPAGLKLTVYNRLFLPYTRR